MKVIIAGSRTNVILNDVRRAVEQAPYTITEIVSGMAKGADQFGELVAAEHNIPIKQFPAMWKDLNAIPCKIKSNHYGSYNALAGHNRNTQMAEYADALIAIWDGKSAGTNNMIKKMYTLNKPVFVFSPGN